MLNHARRLQSLLSLLVICFVLGSSACTLPLPASKKSTEPSPTKAAGLSPALLTQSAATIQADLEQMNAQAAATEAQLTIKAPTTAAPSPTARPTNTPIPPTATSTPTFTALPTETPTPEPSSTSKPTIIFPMVQAFIDTNCRQGPDKTTNVKGYLLAGGQAEVYGRNGISEWWYIANPSDSGQYCWVSSATTEFRGDPSTLPMLIDPTPRPQNTSGLVGFDIEAVNLVACPNGISAVFTVFNTSRTAFESISLKIDDLTTSELLFGPTAHNAPFRLSSQDCSPGGDALWPGNTGYVGGILSAAPLTGHTIQTTIQFCSQENLQGQCFQNTIEFAAP